MDQPERLDYFNPGFIMAFIMAVMADLCGFLLIGILIPGLGIILLAFFFAIHYFIGIIFGFIVIPHLRHFVPKFIVVASIILPLPLLTIAIIIALPMQNKIIETIAEEGVLLVGEAAILAGSLLTGPLAPGVAAAGTAAEGTAATGVAAGGAGVAATGAVGATGVAGGGTAAVGGTAETAERVGRGLERVGKGIKSGVQAVERVADRYDEREDAERNQVSPEALGEEPFFFDKFSQDTFATPEDIPEADNDNEEEDEKKKNVTMRDDDTIDLAA